MMPNGAIKRVFVAGAAGAIGWPLCQLLVADGGAVFGTTRSTERATQLRSIGVEPVVVDVYDADALREAVVAARPDAVVHQLTDLPPGLDPQRIAEARVRNARIRDVGTRHLITAALAAGVRRMVVQSIAFVYAPGPEPHHEDDPLAAFERQVLSAPLEGWPRMTARSTAARRTWLWAGTPPPPAGLSR